MRSPYFHGSWLGSSLAVAFALVAGLPGCSSESNGTSSGAEVDAGRRFSGQRRPAASCTVVLEAPEITGSNHVPEGTALTYNSNPPSSGPHYPV